MLKRKAVKSKLRKKNPDSDPSKVIDFNEEQLEEFYNEDTQVQIEYKYGSFKGHLLHRSSKYTIYFEDINTIFSFHPDDIRKIIRKNKKAIPVIVLK